MTGEKVTKYHELGEQVARRVDAMCNHLVAGGAWDVADLSSELVRFARDVLAIYGMGPGRKPPVAIVLRTVESPEERLKKVLGAVHAAMFPGEPGEDYAACEECGRRHPRAIVEMRRD